MNRKIATQILAQIANDNNTSAENVRREIELALKAAQSVPDPAIQSRWASIPKEGKEPTLEEFLEYMYRILHAYPS